MIVSESSSAYFRSQPLTRPVIGILVPGWAEIDVARHDEVFRIIQDESFVDPDHVVFHSCHPSWCLISFRLRLCCRNSLVGSL